MVLLRRVSTIGGWTLCSRLLGLLRDRLLAGAFGASLQLDAFLLAFALPNLLRNLFGEGALSAAFVPRYVQARADDVAAAEAFAGLVLTRLLALLGLIAGAGMVAAAVLAQQGPADWRLVALLALPQLPYLIFICLAAIAAGMLNGRRHFAVPAAAPVLLNLVLITTVLLCPDIACLPWGVLAAGVLQLGIHLLALWRTGGVPRPAWRASPALRELRHALLPTLVASSIYQLNALFDSLIAFALIADGGGAVTVLYCANRLLLFPMALVAHGVGTAVYPDLAAAANAGYPASTAVLRRSTRLLLALILPSAAGLFLVA
ncbi:MAG: lipid II flippase MurJ, partial [Planctomycetota bacterium]